MQNATGCNDGVAILFFRIRILSVLIGKAEGGMLLPLEGKHFYYFSLIHIVVPLSFMN